MATNAVLERRGSRTALVTTAGFRDVLELRRLRIPHMYDLFWRKPPPLVERHLRFELNERVAADGTVVRPVDEEECRALAAAPARDGRRVGGGLLPALLPLPRARAALRRDPGRGAPGGERLALERDPARAARVRALRDHRRQRLRAAADVLVHRPDPDRPRRDRDRRAAPDHAVVRRRDDRGRREGAAGLRARVGAGGRRRRRPRGWASSSASTTCSPSTWAARPRRRR